jgi:hypothetical protein
MENYQNELAKLSKGNEKFVAFSTPIINTKKKILGVRTPDFKKLAKNYIKTMTLTDLETFITKTMRPEIYEDMSMAAYFLAHIKMPDATRIKLTKLWLNHVDTWALTDSDIRKLPKTFDENQWWSFITESLKSNQEFTVRLGIMLIFANYLNDPDRVFATLRTITHPGYYVKMAIAWTYAEIAVNNFEATLSELQNPNIDTWTRRKALTKMLESRRFTAAQKATIKNQRANT